MRFDSFDFLSPVCNKIISKSESVMDLNSEKTGDPKMKKTKPEGEVTQNKSFNAIGKRRLTPPVWSMVVILKITSFQLSIDRSLRKTNIPDRKKKENSLP